MTDTEETAETREEVPFTPEQIQWIDRLIASHAAIPSPSLPATTTDTVSVGTGTVTTGSGTALSGGSGASGSLMTAASAPGESMNGSFCWGACTTMYVELLWLPRGCQVPTRLGGNAPGRPVCGVLGGTNSGPLWAPVRGVSQGRTPIPLLVCNCCISAGLPLQGCQQCCQAWHPSPSHRSCRAA